MTADESYGEARDDEALPAAVDGVDFFAAALARVLCAVRS